MNLGITENGTGLPLVDYPIYNSAFVFPPVKRINSDRRLAIL